MCSNHADSAGQASRHTRRFIKRCSLLGSGGEVHSQANALCVGIGRLLRPCAIFESQL